MKYLFKFCLLTLILFSVSCVSTRQKGIKMTELKGPERPVGQENVLQLAVDPIPTVRIGFIGVENRGGAALRRYIHMEGVEIKAIFDLKEELVKRGQSYLQTKNFPAADEYVEEDTWKKVCEREDIDLICKCADWRNHTPMAVYAMEQRTRVAIEVPAAVTVDECWQLVNTAEKTRKHFIMLENCCYDFFELTTLNMAQQGVFGELAHGEGAYIHDLRTQLKNMEGWRVKFYESYAGNPYPAHGFVPICQAMKIHGGDCNKLQGLKFL